MKKFDFPIAFLTIMGILWKLHTLICFNAKNMKPNLFSCFLCLVERQVAEKIYTPFIVFNQLTQSYYLQWIRKATHPELYCTVFLTGV